MYPPTAPSAYDAEVVNWWMMDGDVDTLFPNPTWCPMIDALTLEAFKSAPFLSHVANVTLPLQARLAPVLGKATADVNILLTHDCSEFRYCDGYDLPAGLTADLMNAVETEISWQYNYLMEYKTYARLGAGPLLGEVAAALQARLNGDEGAYKFLLYSGHDTGPIMPVLAALGVYDGIWAPYASLISFEVWQHDSTGDVSVRVVYNGDEMRLPACGGAVMCPVDKFVTLLQSLVPAAAECAADVLMRPPRGFEQLHS
jgi:hypothetical protein